LDKFNIDYYTQKEFVFDAEFASRPNTYNKPGWKIASNGAEKHLIEQLKEF
jgi:hypothetical protein